MLFHQRKASSLAAVIMLLAGSLCAYGQREDADGPQRLFAPWSNVALDLELKGLLSKLVDDTEAAQKQADAGRQMREFFGMFPPAKGNGIRFSYLRIRMEPVSDGVSAEALRAGAAEHYPKSQYVAKGSVKQYERGQTAMLKYTVTGQRPQDGMFLGYLGGGYSAFPTFYSVPGMPSSYHALEAYMVRDGTGVLFRYMAPKIDEKDEQFFYAILDSVRLFDASSPSSSYDHFTLGEEFYRRKQQTEAVAALGRALVLEHKQRTLPQPQWRRLVMTLANALGADDEPQRAREILEYGVATEPNYPYFHHGLARLHSYFDNLDGVLAELEKVYQYLPSNSKSFSAWPIPDPLLDPAFQKYADDPKFRDTMKALKKKYKH